MYLTRLLLSVQASKAHDLRDAYSIHKLVYSCFPRQNEEQRFLYADKGSQAGKRQVLILSTIEPGSIPDDVDSSTVELSERFFSFSSYRFEILLNPVRKDNATKKRRPIVGKETLLEWFSTQSAKWGIELNAADLEVLTLPTVTFKKGDRPYTFNRVLFRGSFTVTDCALLQSTMAAGIGHGKAFGFGLLQLIPILPTPV